MPDWRWSQDYPPMAVTTGSGVTMSALLRRIEALEAGGGGGGGGPLGHWSVWVDYRGWDWEDDFWEAAGMELTGCPEGAAVLLTGGFAYEHSSARQVVYCAFTHSQNDRYSFWTQGGVLSLTGVLVTTEPDQHVGIGGFLPSAGGNLPGAWLSAVRVA